MLESHLTIANLPWAPASGEQAATSEITADTAALLAGRFATAYREGDRVVLARDRLGLNKLFVAHHPVRGVVAANYLRDLIRTGIAFRDIHAVPAGAVVTVDPRRRTASTHHYYILPATSGGTGRPQREILAEIDATLRRGMERLAADHTGAPVAICLSGGADSALIALHAKRCFPRATAYTYTYTSDGAGLSQDAAAAQHVAQHLGLDHRLVPADTEAILAALQPALLHGQDWRDFNVHAAVVNTLLAAAIAAEHQTVRGPAPLVLTGDLMNEVLGDYSPCTTRAPPTTRFPPSARAACGPASPAASRPATARSASSTPTACASSSPTPGHSKHCWSCPTPSPNTRS